MRRKRRAPLDDFRGKGAARVALVALGARAVRANLGRARWIARAREVGAERVHRLTPEEYTNSVRELLYDTPSLEPVLDADREPIATLDAVRKWYNAARTRRCRPRRRG